MADEQRQRNPDTVRIKKFALKERNWYDPVIVSIPQKVFLLAYVKSVLSKQKLMVTVLTSHGLLDVICVLTTAKYPTVNPELDTFLRNNVLNTYGIISISHFDRDAVAHVRMRLLDSENQNSESMTEYYPRLMREAVENVSLPDTTPEVPAVNETDPPRQFTWIEFPRCLMWNVNEEVAKLTYGTARPPPQQYQGHPPQYPEYYYGNHVGNHTGNHRRHHPYFRPQ